MKPVLTRIQEKTVSPSKRFTEIAQSKGSVWLDSSMPCGDWGHQSLIASDPTSELILNGNHSRLRTSGEGDRVGDRNDFLRILDSLAENPTKCAIGFVSYEAALPWLGISSTRNPDEIPDSHFLIYDHVTWFNHEWDKSNDANTPDNVLKSGKHVSSNLTKDEYQERVRRIKWHIREGDIYQANMTCRFEVCNNTDPFTVYRRLRKLNPSPYSVYLNFGDYQVLSSSPERVFCRNGDSISSSPIKGTIERGRTSGESATNRQHLLNSAKDRAELLMIVDLIRNDLGKISRTGSVRVDNLFRTETLSSLIHLVADISGELKPRTSTSDIFKALLPGGSITGVPKKRAVEILNELETVNRGVYTGCIGYISGGKADFNLAIRTMTHKDGRYHIHAGSGIVADSDPEAEYNETLLKARNLLAAVGTCQ